MIDRDELDLNGEGKTFRTKPAATRAELLASLETALAESRRALENTTEEHLMKPWRLKMGEQALSEGPRHVMIGNGALSHLAHHRGRVRGI